MAEIYKVVSTIMTSNIIHSMEYTFFGLFAELFSDFLSVLSQIKAGKAFFRSLFLTGPSFKSDNLDFTLLVTLF